MIAPKKLRYNFLQQLQYYQFSFSRLNYSWETFRRGPLQGIPWKISRIPAASLNQSALLKHRCLFNRPFRAHEVSPSAHIRRPEMLKSRRCGYHLPWKLHSCRYRLSWKLCCHSDTCTGASFIWRKMLESSTPFPLSIFPIVCKYFTMATA
jgi:hypothetical protein